MDPNDQLVLVTGGSGFLGAYCILACLQKGYRVRTTIRSLSREKDVVAMLKAGEGFDSSTLNNLAFVAADLTKDDGWADAVKDCTYVLHVASPFPASAPKDENELIEPAREGSLRVLRAARDSKTVKRVVLTSSFAAMEYGVELEKGKPYDETVWTDVHHPKVGAYAKSKTLAEQAAWDFIEKEGNGLELSVINPVGVFGPVLGPDFATSIQVVQRLLNGQLPGCPDLEFGIIDARDVADLHVVAMTHPKAKGERFLAAYPPPMTIKEISLALHEKMGDKARRSPTRGLPNILLRLVALFDPAVALVIPMLSIRRVLSTEKSKTMLGWQPRYSNVDAVVATGESLIKFGLVKS
jgi:nucleoside-diphosphate-sugar epimerase